jgi:hypothetical protein
MSTPESEDVKPWPESAAPIVFYKQPAEYEVVSSERLDEWQARFSETVGLTWPGGGLPTYSFCTPPDEDPCDEDWIVV